VVEDRALLEAFGYPEGGRARLAELWQHLVEELLVGDPLYPEWEEPLRVITREGCLARRMVQWTGAAGATEAGAEAGPPSPNALRDLAGALADCLATGSLLRS